MLRSLLIAAVLCTAGFSNSQCNDLFEKLFDSIYEENHCTGNVCELLVQLQKRIPNQFDNRRARVLYVLPKTHKLTGHASFFPNEKWNFHSVIEYEGEIYDFDYGEQTKSIPIKKYFREMFLPNLADEPTAQNIEILCIPATEYLAEYGRRDPKGLRVDHRYYQTDDAKLRYPPLSIRQVINDGLKEANVSPSLPDKLSEPRIVVSDDFNGNPSVIFWKNFDVTLILESQQGRVIVLRNNQEVNDTRWNETFLSAVASHALSDPLIAPLWKKYLRNKR